MRVVARQHVQSVDVARTFLDSTEVGRAAQAVQTLLVHVDRHPAWVVVQHHRQVRSAIHSQRMQRDFTPRRIGVGRCRNQQSIRACRLCCLGVHDAVFGPDCARSRDHRHASVNQTRAARHHL